MARRNHAAGGFFLVMAIFGGFIWGLMSGLPVHGAIIGAVIGTILAVIVWLIDRKRG
jgi:uncharacterized membrane protein